MSNPDPILNPIPPPFIITSWHVNRRQTDRYDNTYWIPLRTRDHRCPYPATTTTRDNAFDSIMMNVSKALFPGKSSVHPSVQAMNTLCYGQSRLSRNSVRSEMPFHNNTVSNAKVQDSTLRIVVHPSIPSIHSRHYLLGMFTTVVVTNRQSRECSWLTVRSVLKLFIMSINSTCLCHWTPPPSAAAAALIYLISQLWRLSSSAFAVTHNHQQRY